MKDPVPLSPLEPSAAPADSEQLGTKGENSSLSNDLQSHYVSMETSNLQPQTAKVEERLEEDDEALTISELSYRSSLNYSNLYKIDVLIFEIFYILFKMKFI